MIPRVYGHVGTPILLKGNAYDFGHAISGIQFSLNEGETWTTYPTHGTNDYQNLVWSFSYTPDEPGEYHMLIRSVNDAGEASPRHAAVEMSVS